MVAFLVAYDMGAGVGGDDDERDARAAGEGLTLRVEFYEMGGDMVVIAFGFVIGDDDG